MTCREKWLELPFVRPYPLANTSVQSRIDQLYHSSLQLLDPGFSVHDQISQRDELACIKLIKHGHLWSFKDCKRGCSRHLVPVQGSKVSGRVKVGDGAPHPCEAFPPITEPARSSGRRWVSLK